MVQAWAQAQAQMIMKSLFYYIQIFLWRLFLSTAQGTASQGGLMTPDDRKRESNPANGPGLKNSTSARKRVARFQMTEIDSAKVLTYKRPTTKVPS